MRHQNEMLVLFGAGMLTGAGLMYIMDPRLGHRRRVIARDQALSRVRHAGTALSHRAEDLRNRAAGTVASVRSKLHDTETSDDVLVARVRAELGRLSTHPKAIEVSAHDGTVTLSGNVIAAEVHDITKAIKHVRGVHEVRNLVVAHETAGAVPGLQS